ncbi:MAG: AMP-binding protein, partial [Herbaspirillum sp.]
MSSENELLWTPSTERIEQSRMYDYMRWLEREKSLKFDEYSTLWQWSVDHLEDFWESIWQYFDIKSSKPYTAVLDAHKMPGAKWFDGAHLNFAEQVFRFNTGIEEGKQPAIIAQSELRPLSELSWNDFRAQVTTLAHSLRELGIQPGDRVAAYMPNIPETAVAFFACASIGAVWSSCSPDMGSAGVVDRFRQ